MRQTIKNHQGFNFKDAPSCVCDFFIVKARPTKWPGDARFGITAAKKFFKLAVQRNRAKRLLRVWIRANEKFMSPESDYVFIARDKILEAKLPEGIHAVEKCLKKL